MALQGYVVELVVAVFVCLLVAFILADSVVGH
jgi:hypothetical protein